MIWKMKNDNLRFFQLIFTRHYVSVFLLIQFLTRSRRMFTITEEPRAIQSQIRFDLHDICYVLASVTSNDRSSVSVNA